MMPKNHVPEILPVLAANRYTPNVLFMVNNAAGPDEMISALGRERILFGFPGAGFPVAISSQMDAWFKTHVAEVSPMANALFMAGGDNYRLHTYTDPDTQPVADGSARIAINWHGVGIVLSTLVVLIIVLLIL